MTFNNWNQLNIKYNVPMRFAHEVIWVSSVHIDPSQCMRLTETKNKLINRKIKNRKIKYTRWNLKGRALHWPDETFENCCKTECWSQGTSHSKETAFLKINIFWFKQSRRCIADLDLRRPLLRGQGRAYWDISTRSLLPHFSQLFRIFVICLIRG